MTDITQAIQVTTDVEIDWAELGRVLAEEVSTKQADFFMGFHDAVDAMQLAYIAESVPLALDRRNIAQTLRDLAEHLDSEGAQ